MSNSGFEAGIFASDGNFSYVDMEKVFFGRGMRSALPSVPMDQIKQTFSVIGFSSRQKGAIFNLAQKDVDNVLKNSTYFSNFLNPMNGKRPADGIRGDGKRRAYEGKNEIALKLLGQLAETIGLCDSTLSGSARYATKDDNLNGAIKIGPGGQVIITDNPMTWYISPLDMSLMLLDAIEKDPAARKKIFNRYAEETKLEIDFTAFGKDKEKVEEEFEIALINLLKTGINTNFPRAAYRANQRVISYSSTVEEFKKYVDGYKAKFNSLKTRFEELKPNLPSEEESPVAAFFKRMEEEAASHTSSTPSTSDAAKTKEKIDLSVFVEFFRELDKVSSEGMQFGGIDVDGKKIPGVPEKERTFDILKEILEGPAFASEKYAPVRAAALLRIIDFTYARDPILREDAIKWLTKDEKRKDGHVVTNNATELANEINKQIRAYNEGKEEKDRVSEIDPYKQFGFRKENKDSNKIIFDSDAKILKIRALLVDLPPTRATVAIWKKAEETYKNSDEAFMDKLERYTFDYVVRSGSIAKHKPQNLNLLNDNVMEQLKKLGEKYDPQKPDTWDSLDVQIAAKFDRLEELAKDADPVALDEVEIRAFVEEVKQFMADVKPSPRETNGAITLRNIDNLLSGLIDDRLGVIGGGHYDFNLKFFEKDFAEIKRQQKKGDFAVIEHSLPLSTAITELMQMDSYEATFRVIEAAEEFKRALEKTPEENNARIELEESPFKGQTYAKITKIERKDRVTDNKDKTPYSYAVIHFEVNKQAHQITMAGVQAYVSRNENGDLPPFTVWKDLAGIYKNLGATHVNIECDDATTYFAVASAFANLGIECSNDQVKLSPEQEEQVRKILDAAIRRDVATNASVRERPSVRRAQKAVKASQEKVKALQETMDLSLCAEALKKNTKLLDEAALATQTRVTELSEKSSEELATEYVKIRDAGAIDDMDIVAQSEIAEHFADKNPRAEDILTLARLQLQEEGGALYNAKTLGLAISENALDRVEYIADKKDKAQEFIAKIEISHPKTADAFKSCFDEDFDSRNPDAKPEVTFAAMQNTCNALSKENIPDEDLSMLFAEELTRQENIDESIAEYHKLRDYCKGSPVVSKKLKDEVDNFNAAASYALAELRKNPNEIEALLAKQGASKDLQDKINSGEALNLQDIVDLAKVVAKEWNGAVVTPQRAMELEQKRSYEEVERAYKQISRKGNEIADGNMRKIAGYTYMEAANEIFAKKPVDYINLKEQIDFLALSKIAELGDKIGNASMQSAKSLDDLGTITLSAKEFNDCKEVLGLEKYGAAKTLQKEFQNYIKTGKMRS